MKLFISILLFISFGYAQAAEDASTQYISTYKDIAVSEMIRTGIPASIKLAQALLESGSGKSTLAREAKNHFGIKCNGGWEGETYHHKDDDYVNGKLIKSCFRKFNSVSESFIAHSHFLSDQRRYAFLFSYSSKDYYAWAHGLKKAGYATDKAYPQKLIKLIEKYQLYRYDDMVEGVSDPIVADTKTEPMDMPTAVDIPVTVEKQKTRTSRSSKSSRSSRSSKSSRKRSKASSRKSKKGLFRKKSRLNSKSEVVFHIVQTGETLAEISMIHDLDETAVRLRNRLPKNAEPLAGEKIYLRKKISLLNRPEFTRSPNKRAVAAQDDYIF